MSISIEIAIPSDLHALNQISVKSKMHWNYPEEWLRNWMNVLTIEKEYLEKNFGFYLNSLEKALAKNCLKKL